MSRTGGLRLTQSSTSPPSEQEREVYAPAFAIDICLFVENFFIQRLGQKFKATVVDGAGERSAKLRPDKGPRTPLVTSSLCRSLLSYMGTLLERGAPVDDVSSMAHTANAASVVMKLCMLTVGRQVMGWSSR